jgi:hypothetical protein
MHLFETEEGDKWICATCRAEKEAMIAEQDWQLLFDREDPLLRCFLCKKPDYDFDD